MKRRAYPSDVSDEEWALVAPYVTLMTETAPQRRYAVREVFHGLRWLVRAGAPWRMLPNDLPPWAAVYQQPRRWLRAGVFEALVHDLRMVLRVAGGRRAQPSAAILDSRPFQSSPESGGRAGYDGAKRRRGSKVHMAVDTLGHLLARHVTPANEQDRARVKALATQVQAATGETVQGAWGAQGYTGPQPAQAAAQVGSTLTGVKLPAAKQGFVLLPQRWVVERSVGWLARFRRLARDYERLPTTLAGLHFLTFAILMLKRLVPLLL